MKCIDTVSPEIKTFAHKSFPGALLIDQYYKLEEIPSIGKKKATNEFKVLKKEKIKCDREAYRVYASYKKEFYYFVVQYDLGKTKGKK